MPTTGFVLPTDYSNDLLTGTTWSQQANLLQDSDTEAIEEITAKSTPSSNVSGWLKGKLFGLNALIPADAVISKVEIQVRWRVNSTSGIANRDIVWAISGTRGTALNSQTTEPVALTTQTFDVTAERAWTRADLLDGTFEIHVRGRNGNNATSPSYRFAWVKVQVTWFTPQNPVNETMIDNFDRADGWLESGAGGPIWNTYHYDGVIGNARVVSNQMGVSSGTAKPYLKQSFNGDFDLIFDITGGPQPYTWDLIFGIQGGGTPTFDAYGIYIYFYGTAAFEPRLQKWTDGVRGPDIVLGTKMALTAGHSLWLSRRGNTITLYRKVTSGGAWLPFLEADSPDYAVSGPCGFYYNINTILFDNLRGGQLGPSAPPIIEADSVTLSDSASLVVATNIPLVASDTVTLSDSLVLADFTPTTIANCVGWFDASQLGIADGQPVYDWPNLAPGGFALAVQGTYPLVRGPEGGINGRPVTRFVGQANGLYSMDSKVGNEFTVVYVARMYGTTKGRVLGAFHYGGANNFLIGYHGGDWDVAYMEGWLDGFSGPNPLGTTPKLYSADGTVAGSFQGRLFSDGVQIRGPSGGTKGFSNTFGLSGAVFNLQGSDVDIAEIAIYNRKLNDAERQQVEEFLRAKWITPGAALTLDVSDYVTTSDSLDFQNETLIDDFNRTDGLVFVGAGSSIWNSVPLRGGAQTTMRIAGNVLGVANASDQTNNCYTLASLKSDFDLRVDCPVVSSLATEIYFGITDLGGGIWGGYSLVSYYGNPNDQWFIRKYTNVAARTFTVIGTTPSMPTLAANDSLWISKRGSQITAYKKSGTGPWTMLVTATDSTYGAGPMGFDQTDYRSWDNLRGGPFIPAIFASDSVTLSDALSLDWAIDVADSVTLTDNLTLQDFSPSVVPGCTHWLDAEDDSSFTFSSGVLVSQWADKSGNVRHFTQATPGNQPSRTTPENGRNGRPVIAFDGVRYMLRSGAAPFTNVSATIFIVCVETGVHRDYAGFLAAMVAAGNDYDQVNGFDLNNGAVSPNQQFLADRASLGGVISGAAPTPFAVYTTTYAPGTVTPHKNGVAGTAGGATAGGTPPGLCLGSRWLGGVVDLNYGMRGQIAELIIYDRVLNSAERQQLEAYLTTKWLIAGTAHTLNIADNVTVNDSPAFVQDQTLVSADTVTLSDSLLREQDLVLNPVDSVTTSDSATFILDISLFVTEDVVLTDNVIWAQTFQLFLIESDSVTVTDFANLIFEFVFGSTDTVVLTDMLELQVGLYFMSVVVLSDELIWEQTTPQVVVTVI